MLRKGTKIQLIAFAVISIVAVVYALFRFTDIGKLVGQDIYTVKMQLNESGGIFSNAEVTYRGLNVGRVGEMSLTEDGLEVELNIEPGMPPIPQDTEAVVLNRSAIGEQFVDLRPVKAGGPFLGDGDTISADRTKTPPETARVIKASYDFAASVPLDAMRVVVDESFDAFHGTGDNLKILMDATRKFTKGADKNLPDFVSLLKSSNKVLGTLNAEAGSIASFSNDLKLVARSLEGSDADIRRLINATPASARQLSAVVNEIGPGLSALIANAITLGNLSNDRLEGTEQALLTYPALSAGSIAVTRGGDVPLGFVMNFFEPPPCVKGYESTNKRKGSVTTPAPHNTKAYCAEPYGSPINVRGSQNAPRTGSVPGATQPGTTATQSSAPRALTPDDIAAVTSFSSIQQILGIG